MEEENKQAVATLKYARISARKVKIVADLIRGKKVSQAEAILLTTNTKASRLIIKVLNSAVSNAVNNFGANKEDLVIKETYISEGRTLKRRKAASHSRVAKNYHRTSHIYVCVTDNMEKKED